ncbi:DegT/DnrJ/EryC1/StrS family aminotransferase [Longirhabdus pacifica]|uniref:DegT/DnrJ/EryC1/StrS family aminotransferase n=1 Tax=Longirhabdus pacifica TaxID=2305227 RepID=UPI0010086D29|nr:DegT/DnrJ/EryC1/StrS family aminotransferase [Longirhabdus pacifica]
MHVPFIELDKEWKSQQEEIMTAIQQVIDKGQFILGESVQLLEKEIAACCGVQQGIGVANGTDALVLLLQALGIQEGDEVITTPFTFFATVEAIIQVGATPVFADIEKDTFLISPEEVERKCNHKTKAIIAVHLFGQMADMKHLNQIARKYHAYLIEDACQALGASREGESIGRWSDGAAISFFPTKNLGTCGDGGMIVVQNDELASNLKRLRAHGATQKYIHEQIGMNSRLDEIHAAILRVKLKKLKQWNEERRTLANNYRDMLQDLPVQLPTEVPHSYHVYHLYTIVIEERNKLQNYLKQAGIGSGVYYPVPLHLQKPLIPYGFKLGDFPNAEYACEHCLSLPLFPGLTEEQQQTVVEQISLSLRGVQ